MKKHWNWILVGMTVLAGAALFLGRAQADGSRSQAAHEAVQQGALLLDVRTPDEFSAGHIDGAVNIPVQDLDRRMAEVGQKDRTIVVYCRSGARSSLATRMLQSAGYQKIIDLGPMSAW